MQKQTHAHLPRSLESTDSFVQRHIGPSPADVRKILAVLGVASLEELINHTIPAKIRTKRPLELGPTRSEFEMLTELKKIFSQNKITRNFMGLGYSDCITPTVIQRNVLENPAWYTAYTPYQAEIAQGRLEALLNFQTLVMDLTGLQIANASLLDEATAAAEAMAMCFHIKNATGAGRPFFISEACHPQTIEVVRTRAEPLGIPIIVGDHRTYDFSKPLIGALVQYPATDGAVYDYLSFGEKLHQEGALFVVAADLMSLVLLKAPAEFGADVVVGSSQRFGVPLGFGGPHAAYFATKEEYKRLIPGRIVGVSQDVDGRPAFRLALQTREQHIRRDKATSNICTSQVLLAVVASMYAVYHGPEGLKKIAGRIHRLAVILKKALESHGYETTEQAFFDTICVRVSKTQGDSILALAHSKQIELRKIDQEHLTIALDETTSSADLEDLINLFSNAASKKAKMEIGSLDLGLKSDFPAAFARHTPFMTHPVFNTHHSETEMLRYMYRLQGKDLSLTTSMIPLGSCTMKLNATTEMVPISWPEVNRIHPFSDAQYTAGYRAMIRSLESMLAEITGFSGISLQPNSGAQGEYAGLLVIRKYHRSRGEGHRDVCLIPRSAHGTNPASASLAGMKVIVVDTDENGNVNLQDLKAKAEEHRGNLSALMVTYPSTHGVFEETITDICSIVHQNGGQVYMDGANMNAQIGLCRPGEYGPDVCHLNLHKTFCIPHGGGGPGMGPIGVGPHLVPFLPAHPLVSTARSEKAIGPVSAAPWGSASILPISWMYIMLMGGEGLKQATEVAILNANYIAHRLSKYYPVLYKGKTGMVAHECIFDTRQLKASAGIEVEDIAKRLMDYGFHAPTVSFPVAGTMMVEPTESESLAELDRFCDAMIAIREEIAQIESGKMDRSNNPLKNAPHTAQHLTQTKWDHPYTREQAAYPAKWTRENKFWPAVGRINNVLGDRCLICECPPIEAYEQSV